MPMMGIREYARHRGCAQSTVQTAISSGRIRKVAGKIDSEQADADWQANTDPLVGNRSHAKASDTDENGRAYMHEKAERERLRRLQAQLEYEREVGLLAPVPDIEEQVAAVISGSRAKILALPSKVKQHLPHLTNADVLTIDRLIRESLEELANAESLGEFAKVSG
jgi:phage terminase Nu1 subunit (DNA packaging protein)